MANQPSRVIQIARETRTWTSGNVKFTVLGVEGHPEKNYISLEKNLIGKPPSIGVQRFRLSLRDWNNLKKLIEVDLAEKHSWVFEKSGLTLVPLDDKTQELTKLVAERPELIEKLLDAPDLTSLSSTSFEYLNRLARKVFQVQSKNVETVLKNLARASTKEFVQFAALLSDLRLGQVATLANLVKQKLEIISLFEKLTNEPETREKEVHELIAKNPWIANKSYEVLASDKPLAQFLEKNVKDDPELKTRPDLIVRRVPNDDQIVLIELKRPSVKLCGAHIGQVLDYRDLICQFKPNVRSIECFLFGYQKQTASLSSKDVTIHTFSELTASLRDDYQCYLKVLEEDSAPNEDEDDIPF